MMRNSQKERTAILTVMAVFVLGLWMAVAVPLPTQAGENASSGSAAAQSSVLAPPATSEPTLIEAVYDPVPGSGAEPVHVRNAGILAPAAQPNASRMPEAEGMTPRVDLDTLILVYTNTCMGTVTSGEIGALQEQITRTAEFLWRHSHLKLRLSVTYLFVDTYKDLTEFTEVRPDAYWLEPGDGDGDGESVENDLLNLGVAEDEYDSINYFWRHNGSYGVAYGGLGGLICWSLGCHSITQNPILGETVTPEGASAFPHEIQHSIDFMLDNSGYPDYFHADQPWNLSGAFGENWDFWVSGMERWPIEQWFVLNEPWGTIVSATDADNDGVPDEALDELATEVQMGSSPLQVDSDDDGLADRNEAMAGIYRGSAATNPDTDADGLADGVDTYPLYTTAVQIVRQTHTFDGDPSGWDIVTDKLFEQNAPLSVTVAANWDDDYLYLMVIEDRFAGIHIQVDANNDGWYHGRDNYEITVDPSYPDPADPSIIGVAHLWDSSEDIIAETGQPMWDDDPNYPHDPWVTRAEIVRYARAHGSGFLVQLGIPVNPDTGMTPGVLEEVGLLLQFDYLDRLGDTFARLWEREAWVRPILVAEFDTTPPVSAIDSLTATQVPRTLGAEWSGADTQTGVAYYDTQIREGSEGEWTDWLRKTNATSALYTVGDADAYYFRVRAWDNAGNAEKYASGDGDRHVYTYSASGQVTTDMGEPIPGVELEISGYASGCESDASGVFTIAGLLTGTYELRPQKDCYAFEPSSRMVTLPPGVQGQDFVGRSADYTLTTSASPSAGGSVGVSPEPTCGTGYTLGTVVQLTATASTGYTFTNWSGDASGTANPVSVTMDANKTVTANFAQAEPFGQISTGDGYDNHPALAYTSGGHLVAAWERSGGTIWQASSLDEGTTWSSQVQVGAGAHPSLLSAADGRLWLAYRHDGDIWARTSADEGGTWSDEANLTAGGADDENPTLTQTSDSALWLVWGATTSEGTVISFKRSLDNGVSWTAAQALPMDPAWCGATSIAQGGDGKVWIIWFQTYDFQYSTSSDNGVSWTAPTSLGLGGHSPRLRTATDGKMWFSWGSLYSAGGAWRTHLAYRTSDDNGATWGPEQRYTVFNGENNSPDMAALPGGQVAFAWFSNRTGAFNIWFGRPGVHADTVVPPSIMPPSHSPAAPSSTQVVSFTAAIADVVAVSSAQLRLTIDGVQQPDQAIYDDGNPPDVTAEDGVYTGEGGPFPAGASVIYQFHATNTDGLSALTPPDRSFFIPADLPPNPPTNLSATAASQTQINMSWQDNSTDESSFHIERSPDGSSGWVEIDTVGANATIYSDTGLSCGTTYHYRVRAYRSSDGQYSGYSNVDSATTQACPPPIPPTNLSATAASQTQINLSWQDNSTDESTFHIERSPDGTSGWAEIDSVAANVTSYGDTGLTVDTLYCYRVRAYRASDEQYSGYSNVDCATTQTVPAAILRVGSGNVAPGQNIVIPVEVLDLPAQGLGAATVEIQYDPTVLSAVDGGCTEDPGHLFTTVLCNPTYASDKIRITASSVDGVSADAVLAEITFEAIGAQGEFSTLDITALTFADPGGVDISVIDEDGEVVLGTCDVNCDGFCNAVDALFVLQREVGLRPNDSDTCPPPSDGLYVPGCDVSQDGQCNSIDALFILQCEVGIANVLCPASGPALDSTPGPVISPDDPAEKLRELEPVISPVDPAEKLREPEPVISPADTAEKPRELEPVILDVGSGDVAAGTDIEIPVTMLAGEEMIGAATIEIQYDPSVLNVIDCAANPKKAFDSALCNTDPERGVVRLSAVSAGGTSGIQALANITFQAIGQTGESSAVTLEVTAFARASGLPVKVGVRAGQIDIVDVVLPDPKHLDSRSRSLRRVL
jgi:uncharacterized repeat protein (TIGR02543 family)